MHPVLSEPRFHNEEAAFEYVEAMLWPNGPVCPHCGNADAAKIGRLQGQRTKPSKKNPEGAPVHGLWKCYACREQFTVRIGTVFEASHAPLHCWLQAIHLICSSKKGISTRQLQRTLGGSMKTAWFLGHRIREMMALVNPAPVGNPGQSVEIDETYIGTEKGAVKKRGGGQHKRKVISLVERGGSARSFHVGAISTRELHPILREHLSKAANAYTDESRLYNYLASYAAKHERVNHGDEEWKRGQVHTNTVEGFFSVFKRGMIGVYQQCGDNHLHRYLAEFDFRYSNRSALGVEDVERAQLAVKGAKGKRLTYETTRSPAR